MEKTEKNLIAWEPANVFFGKLCYRKLWKSHKYSKVESKFMLYKGGAKMKLKKQTNGKSIINAVTHWNSWKFMLKDDSRRTNEYSKICKLTGDSLLHMAGTALQVLKSLNLSTPPNSKCKISNNTEIHGLFHIERATTRSNISQTFRNTMLRPSFSLLIHLNHVYTPAPDILLDLFLLSIVQ